jgi:hypothetical protein
MPRASVRWKGTSVVGWCSVAPGGGGRRRLAPRGQGPWLGRQRRGWAVGTHWDARQPSHSAMDLCHCALGTPQPCTPHGAAAAPWRWGRPAAPVSLGGGGPRRWQSRRAAPRRRVPPGAWGAQTGCGPVRSRGRPPPPPSPPRPPWPNGRGARQGTVFGPAGLCRAPRPAEGLRQARGDRGGCAAGRGWARAARAPDVAASGRAARAAGALGPRRRPAPHQTLSPRAKGRPQRPGRPPAPPSPHARRLNTALLPCQRGPTPPRRAPGRAAPASPPW